MNYKRIYSISLDGLEWDRKDFCIHHINLNHNDDNFDNLVLIPSNLVISGAMEFFRVKKQMERFYDLKRLILVGCFYDVHDFQKIVNSCCFIAEQYKKR